MNTILDNESFPIEDRLAMAKELLIMKEKQIQELKAQLDNEKSTRDWNKEQENWHTCFHRMGL